MLLFALGTYILTAPVWLSAIQKIDPVGQNKEYTLNMEGSLSVNQLEIPSISVKSEMGESEKDDVWFAKEPNFEGNVVIAGHRFRYTNPLSSPFYFLDRVEKGELIILRYFNIEYTYQVMEIFEVKENEVWIEGDYTFPSITLYTCTPIYNPQKRLVIVGKLVSIR